MRPIREIIQSIFGPTSKFAVGDSVELINGGKLMVVMKITEAADGSSLIHCQWTESGSVKNEVFPEDGLRIIDWYGHRTPES